MPRLHRLLFVVVVLVVPAADARADISPPPPTASDADTGEPPAPEAPDYRRSRVLYWTTFSLATLHLTDHLLRNNHSGWPFTDQVTPGTVAYFAVPAIFVVGLELDGPLYGVIADSAILATLLLAHTAIETPSHVYRPWANGSNLLEVKSEATGTVAVTILAGATISASAHLISNILDGREHGFTWRRRSGVRDRSVPPIGVVPLSGGGGLVATGWSF